MRFRAYLFDVQGTLLDFFNPVSAAVGHYLDAAEIDHVDADEFTRRWRADYYQRLQNIPQSRDNWRRAQDSYEVGFSEICARYRMPQPDPAAARTVSLSWQRLQPWPDVRAGMATLRKNAITAALSNTDMSTAISLFKHHAIDMDAIFTAEIFGAFKPDPVVYLRSLQYLGLRPDEAAMVASHPYDLEAAASLGLGTVFLSRPDEYGDRALAHQMPVTAVGQHVRTVGEID